MFWKGDRNNQLMPVVLHVKPNIVHLFYVWQFEVGWLQWCLDPWNLSQGLGAALGPGQEPAPPLDPEVVPDPGPESAATGRVYFTNNCPF